MLFILRMVLLSLHFVLVCVAGMALVLVRPFNPDNSRLLGAMFNWPAMRLMGLRIHLDLEVLRKQPRSYVIVANHQSNHDLFVLGCVVPPRTVTIGKKSLKWIPLFGQIYWLSGNVLIDRGNAFQAKKAMQATTKTLQKDTNIWVFAEGTRNLGRGLKPFKKGAFHMAINAGVPIIPICTSTYKKHIRLNSWHAGDVMIKALPPLSTQGMSLEDLPALMARCHTEMATCIEELDDQVKRLAH